MVRKSSMIDGALARVPLRQEIRHALLAFVAGLRSRFGTDLERAVLFGSHARGVVHEESDVDVLVLLRDRRPGDVQMAIAAAVEVMLAEPEIVLSPLVLSVAELDELRRRERLFAREIDRDGIAL
jgi:predicted nucleotidyltransferase